MPDKILIIGGGFAGFLEALAARRVAAPPVEVTLVSHQPLLEIRPRLYEAKPRRSLSTCCRSCARSTSASYAARQSGSTPPKP